MSFFLFISVNIKKRSIEDKTEDAPTLSFAIRVLD